MKLISMGDIMFAIYLRLKIVIIFVILFLALSLLYILITKPIYNPTAIVKANVYETVPTWIATLLQQRLVPTTPVDRMAGQVELIKVLSPSVLKENGANLEFKISQKFFKIIERRTIVDTIRKNLKFDVIFYPDSIAVFENKNKLCSDLYDNLLNCNYFSFKIKKIKSFDKPIKGSIVYKNFPLTIDSWMKNKVIIDQIGISDLVKITVEDENPEYAALLANKIAQKYVDYSIEEERRLARETRKKLEVFYEEAVKRVDSLKKIIRNIKLDTLSLVTYIIDFGLGNEPMAKIVDRYFNNPGDKVLEKVSRAYVSKSMTLEEVGAAYNILVGQRNNLMSLIEQTKLAEARTVSVAQIVDYATIPAKPKWPKKSLLLLLSIFFGVFFGILAVIIWERYDNRIYTPLKLKFLMGDNFEIFHNVDDLKAYLVANGFNKVYSTEKLNKIESVDLSSADIHIIVVNKGMDKSEFLKMLKKSSNKEKVIFLKL